MSGGNGPGGLKVGDLYVSVTAAIGDAVKNLSQLVEAVGEAADEIEELASKGAAALGDMSDGFLTLAAAATGAFILGAQGNKKMADAMEELEGVTRTLAIEFAKDLVPLVKDLTRLLKEAVAWYRNLSDGQRQAIVSAVKWSFILGTGLKALERGIVFGKSFAEGTVAISKTWAAAAPHVTKAFGSISKEAVKAADAVAAIGKRDTAKMWTTLPTSLTTAATAIKNLPTTLANIGPALAAMRVNAVATMAPFAGVAATVLAVVAAVGALVVLTAVLRDAWEQSGSGITQWLDEVAKDAIALGKTIATFVGDIFSSLTSFLRRGVEVAFEFIAAQVRWISKMAAPVAKFVGAKDVAAMFEAMANTSGKKMLEYLEKGSKELWDAGKGFAQDALNRVSEIASRTRDALAGGASVSADILKTAIDSAKRGFALLNKDLGLSEFIEDITSKMKALLPQAPSENDIENVGATNNLSDIQTFAREALKSVRDVTQMMVEHALQEKRIAEAQQKWLGESVMGPQFDILFRESIEPAMKRAKEYQDALVKNAKDMADRMQQARDALINKFLSRLGDAYAIAESAYQGFQMGGIWGAIIAVILDLLSRSQAFVDIVEMGNGAIKQIADSIGRLLEPMKPLVAALLQLDVMVGQFLGPILEQIGRALGQLAPFLILIGEILSPILAVFGGAIEAIIQAFVWIAEKTLPPLFEVLKMVGLIIMGIIYGLESVWNGILSVIQKVFRAIANKVVIFGDKPFDFLNDWADGLEGAKADTDGLMDAMVSLERLTWDAAKAKAKEIEQTYKTVDALNNATEALTNVPTYWKVPLGRFNAQDAKGTTTTPSTPSSGGSSAGGGNSGTSASPPATVNEAPGVVVESVVINAIDPNAAADAWEASLDRVAMRQRGTRGRGRNYDTVVYN
ncbi:hypothetical protein [Vitiosangium sp. GDMCC 1.1324]|uniref:hypothetical protein n=1 Tax=Vitiosangium sp. (strain GDMCC 1.1324) TaxID=2138576 RepID=UPI000D340C23|nr:hypothetical protein [Vitiosangium sp. GDMCC 1.1324]PTL79087.1 hypothetical protein DAT35_36370 [Vitiosangium sp. GDMCC 1.1324]